MATEHLIITEYVVPASFVRGFSRAVRDETTDRLCLAVKRYAPKWNRTPQIGDPTIILAQGTGFVKELYEPFLDEIVQTQPRVREFWLVDAVIEGASYALNQHKLGDEYHWFDHSRDLMQMMNHFQSEMVPPFIGIGHSRGATQILMLASYHPRLFRSLVVIEPGVEPGFDFSPIMGSMQKLTVKGRDRWPSRTAAEASLKKSPFHASWDPRVLRRQLQYGLSSVYKECTPVKSRERPGEEPTRLSTPITMQLHGYFRPDPPLTGYPPGPDYRLHEDSASVIPGFYRSEGKLAYDVLPNLYPTVLFVWGAVSPATSPRYRKEVAEVTGIGPGGSGGLQKGMVESVEIPQAGHCAPFEQVHATAKVIADWIDKERETWLGERKSRKSQPGFSSNPNPEYILRTSKIKL